jgi:hypothetical protein
MELAGRDLLQRRGVEDIIYPTRGVRNRPIVAHIAQIIAKPFVAIEKPLVLLLLLVTAENPDSSNGSLIRRSSTVEPNEPVPPVMRSTLFSINARVPTGLKLRKLARGSERAVKAGDGSFNRIVPRHG